MRICFIHQNLPAQYRYLIHALLKRGDTVLAIGEQRAMRRWSASHPNLATLAYALPDGQAHATVPPHLRGIDLQIQRAQAVNEGLRELRRRGLEPDLVVAHPGWGEALYVRGELPHTPLLSYCEFYYRAEGADVGFDPEYPSADRHWQRLQLRNLPLMMALHDMDAGWCATNWQRAQFPAAHQPRLQVLHEGIDTEVARPNPRAELVLGGHRMRRGDPVVTYVARNLEPYRGFHTFMRSLPLLQQLAPRALVVIVGGDAVSYGLRLPPGQSYRQRLVDELDTRVDWSRVVFTGNLPYAEYLKVLQVSAVHAYLSYPFVLSWSLLEAMACGCVVVGSATPPVMEVARDGENALLVDFFDAEALARRLADVLAGRVDTAALAAGARRTVVDDYDLHAHCLPAGLAMLDRLVAARGGSQ